MAGSFYWMMQSKLIPVTGTAPYLQFSVICPKLLELQVSISYFWLSKLKPSSMNILVLGSGGREHAFAHQLARSEKCSRIFVAPGNAGTATIATNVSLNVNDFDAVKELVLEEKIEMVVVGPEDPLEI